MTSDPFTLLARPGGGGRLVRDGDALVDDQGQRYPIEDGIVRMLEAVDPGLAAELDAQEACLPIYLNEGFLLTRYERTLARIAIEDLLGTVSGPILDAGCGVGIIGRFYPHMDLYALDASMPLLRQIGPGYRMRIEGSAEKLPFQDGAFSAVLSLNMLHHVMNPQAAIAELARVLRPGGIFVALDPRKVALIEIAKKVMRRNDPGYAETHRAFAVREYAQLIAGSGALRLEEYRRFGFLALLGAGGLDQLKVSHRLPAPGAILGALTGIDNILAKAPGFDRSGLYLGVRARRIKNGTGV